MREFKFRVWHTLDNKMIYEGWNGNTFKSKCDIFKLGESGIIMQFTGFTDINKIEIYEGDIMEYGKIVWSEWFGSFILEGKDWQHNMHYARLNYAVTGNIYENK